MSSEGPNRKPASYSFAQQTDSSCHVMPFINLGILQPLRQSSLQEREALSLKDHALWFNKRQWLPQTFLWTKEWQQAMSRALDTPFGEYQKAMLQNGILSGHVYDAAGNSYLQTWNPVENYARMLLVPYNFTDIDKLPSELGLNQVAGSFKTLPLFWDQGKAIAYDPERHDYADLHEVTTQSDIDKGEWDFAIVIVQNSSMQPPSADAGAGAPSSSSSSVPLSASTPSWQQTFAEYKESISQFADSVGQRISPTPFSYTGSSQVAPSEEFFPTNKAYYRYYRLTPAQAEFLSLPKHSILNHVTYSSLGYEMGFKYRYLPESAERHSYYMSSLLQLMLFCMGVDNQNNVIDENHPLYAAHCALKNEMEKTPHNPWALPAFKKENLLEYQLAKLIQASPLLKSKMIATVNIFFNAWDYYQALDKLYDSPDPNTRQSLHAKKHWLLGEDLFLAYCYVMNARFLWAAATSRQAFNAVLELDPALARILQLPFAPGPNQLIRNAQAKCSHGYSYLDVWDSLRRALIGNPDIPKELASFSGHGIVMSLYKDLFDQQMKNGVSSPKVMNRLGFSVIDSYYGEHLSPMYRDAAGKTATHHCDIQELVSETVKRRAKHRR